MEVKGHYFAAGESTAHPSALNCGATGYVTIPGIIDTPIHLNELKVSERLGRTPRKIRFPDGGQFETSANQQIDDLLRQHTTTASALWLHRLETRWRSVLASVVITVLVCWAFVVYGVPGISRMITQALPASVVQAAGENLLDYMDDILLEPSQLPTSRQQALTELFESLLPEDSEGLNYRLSFRHSEQIGPNAFALPSGDIVMTDQLVLLAEDDNEIASIFLHEIGHVHHRHNLRRFIEQSTLGALVVLVTGDVSGASSLVLLAPSLMLEARFSQDIEWEADTYALERMDELGIPRHHFADIMSRMTATAIPEEGQEEDPVQDHQPRHSDGHWLDYFGSHPPSRERIERFSQP